MLNEHQISPPNFFFFFLKFQCRATLKVKDPALHNWWGETPSVEFPDIHFFKSQKYIERLIPEEHQTAPH